MRRAESRGGVGLLLFGVADRLFGSYGRWERFKACVSDTYRRSWGVFAARTWALRPGVSIVMGNGIGFCTLGLRLLAHGGRLALDVGMLYIFTLIVSRPRGMLTLLGPWPRQFIRSHQCHVWPSLCGSLGQELLGA